ncbi:hypothetical protein CC80DRAFT_162527 [Byssothecium circinans]|uniref:Uncharacterized protein n=1 Tax=Byssothecium circinans TaxID=147558 RepID=A0A6A5UFL8_9PLEO|nr:hypothetical protein CC80DRAFT_162527 [Byssothecium circinans]
MSALDRLHSSCSFMAPSLQHQPAFEWVQQGRPLFPFYFSPSTSHHRPSPHLGCGSLSPSGGPLTFHGLGFHPDARMPLSLLPTCTHRTFALARYCQYRLGAQAALLANTYGAKPCSKITASLLIPVLHRDPRYQSLPSFHTARCGADCFCNLHTVCQLAPPLLGCRQRATVYLTASDGIGIVYSEHHSSSTRPTVIHF